MEELAQSVEDTLRSETSEPSSQQVGVAVLAHLKALDDVAYLRFASVYKGFEDAGDFQREVGLLTKTTEPKRKVMRRDARTWCWPSTPIRMTPTWHAAARWPVGPRRAPRCISLSAPTAARGPSIPR